MASSNIVQFMLKRSISTSARLCGKRNFRKFPVYNKRGTRIFKEMRRLDPNRHPEIPIDKRGVRYTGMIDNDGNFVELQEKIPELIIPSLEGCQLKPYVSYKAPEVIQTEFTSEDLFNAIYAKKIVEDYKANKLTEDGLPIEPSAEEKLTPELAKGLARKTGSDIF